MKKVGVGIVGLGSFGEQHLQVLANMPDVQVTAICSRTPERMAELGNKYRVPGWYSDFRELVVDPDVDVVDVCTRDWEHVEPSVAAARAGKHLFLEKPIAGSITDGKKILDAVEEAGIIFMVGHILRFDERHMWLKERISAGDLGKIAALYFKRDVTRKNNFTGRAVSPILGSQIHDIDLALWFTKDQPISLYTIKNHALGQKMLDVAVTVMSFANGLVATIQTVWLVPLSAPSNIDAHLEAYGTVGTVKMNSLDQGVTLWSDERAVYPNTSIIGGIPGGALRSELHYFIECVKNDKQPTRITSAEAWKAFELACLAMDSAERGEPIKLTK